SELEIFDVVVQVWPEVRAHEPCAADLADGMPLDVDRGAVDVEHPLGILELLSLLDDPRVALQALGPVGVAHRCNLRRDTVEDDSSLARHYSSSPVGQMASRDAPLWISSRRTLDLYFLATLKIESICSGLWSSS